MVSGAGNTGMGAALPNTVAADLPAGLSLTQALRVVQAALQAAECPDAAFDAADLLLLATGVQARLAPPERVLSAAEAVQLAAITARRVSREPLQYIWGRWPFLNFELVVGSGVLCPRADTEIVVEYAAKCCQAALLKADVPSVQVLELCGGSGCIGLGIKMFCPTAQVTVLEKSLDALPYLRENAKHALDEIAAQQRAAASVTMQASASANLAARKPDACGQPLLTSPYLNVVEGDLFAYHATLPDAAFDLLVSNPPYLTAQEMTALQPEVAQEPAMALAAGADGLDFYRAIATDYKRVVKQGGFLVLEIGCAQAADVMALLSAAGWDEVTCRQDYGKNDRCVIARCGAQE
ncbi:MAG: HemK/PrmC family methyltransferase [Faecalibacterium sp.]